jgi:hypothetical protein
MATFAHRLLHRLHHYHGVSQRSLANAMDYKQYQSVSHCLANEDADLPFDKVDKLVKAFGHILYKESAETEALIDTSEIDYFCLLNQFIADQEPSVAKILMVRAVNCLKENHKQVVNVAQDSVYLYNNGTSTGLVYDWESAQQEMSRVKLLQVFVPLNKYLQQNLTLSSFYNHLKGQVIDLPSGVLGKISQSYLQKRAFDDLNNNQVSYLTSKLVGSVCCSLTDEDKADLINSGFIKECGQITFAGLLVSATHLIELRYHEVLKNG